MLNQEILVEDLNAAEKERRLTALSKLIALYDSGKLTKPVPTDNVNNHIHTTFSFSPYSPAKAAYMAWLNGLTTAGIMDHDSIAGADEFIKAGKILKLATTVGVELRCGLSGTPFEGRRVNNPDQNSVVYLAMHGVPHQNITRVQRFLTPYREKRNIRNRKMTGVINRLLEGAGLSLDFDADVAAISEDKNGGSITERHILYALSLKIADKLGRGQPVLDFLKKLNIQVSASARGKLLEKTNDMYEYYLLGALKSGMVEKFYIPATDECPHITEFIKLADEIGAVSAYAYLGDVGDSVTGDKKAQAFEDAFLDELMEYLKAADFRAVTYMPTRNTKEQLARVISLCGRHGFFQISGEDINSPFQTFICEALKEPQFKHLIASTWALIGHEKTATENVSGGMFSKETVARTPGLNDRVNYFEKIGRNG
ncbi:MAG: PHP domain-containing protein [Oscillospiraceae bacterium]|nr:PHP domain-containing protein [Oscillospiraceae bacterium]